MISNYKIYDSFVPCNLSKFQLLPVIWANFWLTPYYIIDFIQSKSWMSKTKKF